MSDPLRVPANGEFWLSGAVDGVPPLLMPVAHALLQARHDMRAAADGLTREQLWARPGGAAAVGFHLRHAAGSLDRLFTYARGAQLDDAQRAALRAETEVGGDAGELLDRFDATVDRAIAQLRETDPSSLLDPRGVGRRQLPSNVLGLLFHAAEHTQRHTGQAIATAKAARATA
jgi:uncharacterized damage-inducible protein DinB